MYSNTTNSTYPAYGEQVFINETISKLQLLYN